MDAILGSDAQRAASSTGQTPAQKPQNVIRFIEKALKAQRAISTFDREQESATGVVNAVKHTVNEFEELYLDTLIAYYVAVHYMRDHKYLEALHLSKHTLS